MLRALFVWFLILFSISSFASYTVSIPKTVIKLTNRTEYPSSALRISFILDCKYGFENASRCGDRKTVDLKIDQNGTVTIDPFQYVLKAKRHTYFARASLNLDFGVEMSQGGLETTLEKIKDLNDGLTLFKLSKRVVAPVIDGLSVLEFRKKYGADFIGFSWKAELALPHYGLSDFHTTRATLDEVNLADEYVALYRGAASDLTLVNYSLLLKIGYGGPEWQGSVSLKNNSELVTGASFKTDLEKGALPATWNDYSYGLNNEISELTYSAKVVCGADKRITGVLSRQSDYPVTGTCDKYPYQIEVKNFPVKNKQWKDIYRDLRLVIPFTSKDLVPAEVYDLKSGERLGEMSSFNSWRTGL